MKAEFDNEIDALLRRNARAARGVARDGGERDAREAAHLDADELSAFAENALPAAARLSAASHLADCDDCRGVAVSLARAAGDVEKRAAVAAPPSEGRAASARGWLASLFSPRALRFVAPALAVCLLGAVALLILRTRREGAGDSVVMRSAERDAARPNAAPVGPDAGANANANANVAAGMLADNANAPETPSQTTAPTAPDASGPSVAAADDESPDGSGSQTRDTVSQSSPPLAATRNEAASPPPPPPRPAEAAPVGTSAAPAAQPPAPREVAKEAKEDARHAQAEEAEVARAENLQLERRGTLAGNADNQQTPDGAAKKPASSAAGSARSTSPRPEPERRNRSLGGPVGRREAGEDAARDRADADAAAETRSVAGRRFRREGGAWVDVNYRPTMSMTGVRRGTEAYRALVADHPELGRIAEQLGGEVIAVISGRAYRIR